MQQTTADELLKLANDESIEANLLQKKLIRNLYKELGTPSRDDFPDAYKHASYWQASPGYTTGIEVCTPDYMECINRTPVDYRIKRPSHRKMQIIEEYTRDGWAVQVQAYNVLCYKYIRHPRYDNVAVRFYITRDAARYNYVLVEE